MKTRKRIRHEDVESEDKYPPSPVVRQTQWTSKTRKASRDDDDESEDERPPSRVRPQTQSTSNTRKRPRDEGGESEDESPPSRLLRQSKLSSKTAQSTGVGDAVPDYHPSPPRKRPLPRKPPLARRTLTIPKAPRKSTPRLDHPNSEDEEGNKEREDDEVGASERGGEAGGTGGAVGAKAPIAARIHASHRKDNSRKPIKLPMVPILSEEEEQYWKENLADAEHSFFLTRGTLVMKQFRECCS